MVRAVTVFTRGPAAGTRNGRGLGLVSGTPAAARRGLSTDLPSPRSMPLVARPTYSIQIIRHYFIMSYLWLPSEKPAAVRFRPWPPPSSNFSPQLTSYHPLRITAQTRKFFRFIWYHQTPCKKAPLNRRMLDAYSRDAIIYTQFLPNYGNMSSIFDICMGIMDQ
jgi:hypothetical protein